MNNKFSEEFLSFVEYWESYSSYVDGISDRIKNIIDDLETVIDEKVKKLIFLKIEIEKELIYSNNSFAIEGKNEPKKDPNISILIVHKIRIEQILSNFYATKKIVDMDEDIFKPYVKKTSKTSNETVSVLSSPQLSILLQLLYSKKVFIGNRKDFLTNAELLTGYKEGSLNNDLWEALKMKKSLLKNCIATLSILDEMRKELIEYINTTYPNEDVK